jgi:hypothetical protein
MNLESNEHGFMFYNEVLFGFYKNMYTKHPNF